MLDEFYRSDWRPSLEAEVNGGTLKTSTVHGFYLPLIEHHVLPSLRGTLLRELDAPSLNRLYGELLTKGLSTTTVHSIHVAVGRMLSDAVRWHRLVRNPAPDASPPAPAKPEMKVWSGSELRAFLEAVSADRLFAFWHLLVFTGMRRGEAAGLRWVDVDLEATSLRVSSTRVVVHGRVASSTPKTSKVSGRSDSTRQRWPC